LNSKTQEKEKGEHDTSMKSIKRLFFTVPTLAALTAGAWAQTEAASILPPAKRPADMTATVAPPAVTQADFQVLKEGLAAAQRQIQALHDELQRRDLAVQQAQDTTADASAKANAFQVQSSQDQQAVGALKSDAADLRITNTATLKNAALAMQDPPTASPQEPQQVFNKEMESAITIRFRGINITPGGFAAAEFVRRSRALGADVTTPFNSLTMPGASQSSMSEFFGSARQSRPTVFVEGRVKNVDLSSYVSGDFLSAGTTSTATQTNSYTFRLRQVWGQAKFENGWSVLGGQMWSLLTENVAGISPADDVGKTNDARPKTIDSAYNVGFSFARQYGIRVTKSFGNKVAVAAAMENPQATLTTHGNADNFLLGAPGASNSYNSTANYSFNPSPDFIAKTAFDPGFGHYEVFGLFDRFRDRIFPCVDISSTALCGGSSTPGPNALGAFNASKNGGGVGANARWGFHNKGVVFGLHGFGGSGVGRYGAGQLSDVAINANGTLHLVKGYQGLGTLEFHTKKLDVYFYGGAEYASRTADFDPVTSTEVGYGAPKLSNSGCYSETMPNTTGAIGFNPGSLSKCTADTRLLGEATGGFWYRFYSGPRGRLQFGTQYSYVRRQTWSGAGFTKGIGVTPEGLDSMVFTSFRYYLP
jgi:hypothetical protein